MTFPGHPGPRGQHRRCTEPLSIARGSRISCSKFCRRCVDELWNLFFWHGSWIPQLFLCSSHRGSPKHLKTMIDWTILIILVGLEIAKMRFGPQGNKAAKVVVRDLIIQNPKLYKLHMTLFTWVLSHCSKYEIAPHHAPHDKYILTLVGWEFLTCLSPSLPGMILLKDDCAFVREV